MDARGTDDSRTIVFVMNFIAIVPLAGLLSNGTEEVSLYCSEVIGGLLNVTPPSSPGMPAAARSD